MKLGIPVNEGVNLLDVTGPWGLFRWVDSSKKLETVLLSLDGGPVTTNNGLRFEVHASFAATPGLGRHTGGRRLPGQMVKLQILESRGENGYLYTLERME